jgi:amino acid permease
MSIAQNAIAMSAISSSLFPLPLALFYEGERLFVVYERQGDALRTSLVNRSGCLICILFLSYLKEVLS